MSGSNPTAPFDSGTPAVLDAHAFEEATGVSFSDEALLELALTHTSYANEHPDEVREHNERLEFLGDAVLSAVVATELYRRYPDEPEGRLTEWRASLVQGKTLSEAAQTLGLGPWLRLGRGEEQTGGRERDANLEAAYEALVGAIYLDHGGNHSGNHSGDHSGHPEGDADRSLGAARRFVLRTLGPQIEALSRNSDELNPKGVLQELLQEQFDQRPEYVLTDESGPEHARSFAVEVRLAGEVLGRGAAGSKQEAEKEAAAEALPKVRARIAQEAS